jgi:Amt family ammonium transporter
MDPKQLKALQWKVFENVAAASLVPLMRIGDELKLFTTLSACGPADSASFAKAAGIHARYALEWLSALSAAGYVSLQSALIIGVVAAIACHYAARLVKTKLKTDDTVDVFACHGIGGTVGALLTAVFASSEVNPAISNGLMYGETKIFFANLIGSMVVIAFTMVMTYIVFKVVGLFMAVRVSEADEKSGLDATQHGEKAFVLR